MLLNITNDFKYLALIFIGYRHHFYCKVKYDIWIALRTKGMDVGLKHIVCTADFSDYSEHAVSYGIELAKEFGAKLYLCYVIHIPHYAVYSIAVSDSLERRI